MKKENKFLELLNSKGFYTALFTCLFAILAIAAFVSIRNIDAISKLSTYGEKDQAELGDYLQPAASQRETPLAELGESSRSGVKVQNKAETPDAGKDVKPQTKPQEQPAPQSRIRQIDTDSGSPKPEEAPPANDGKQNQTSEANEAGEQSGQAKTDTNGDVKSEEKETEEAKAPAETAPGQKPQEKQSEKSTSAFAAFNEGEQMSWPLDGAIAMDFSMLHAIYDKTLDQYRTNPTVSISADVGTQVKAAADGMVKAISISPRDGHTVILDHGNGWQTVYSQLQETILVKEGDTVERGQAIGGVGAPTKYGVLLGSHLVFGVNKDEMPQNPKLVLAADD